MDLIASYCDEILVMNEGEIAYSGKTYDVLSNPDIMEAGAMIPQSALFGNEMKKAGKSLREVPITVGRAVELVNEWKQGNNGN